MKRIILFRFHKNAVVCGNRIDLLRHYNPGTKIFGLYGGDEGRFPAYQKKLGAAMDDIYCIRGRSDEWKWKNGDLAIRRWFIDCGEKIPFDMLHVIEWDMLLCDSVENIFSIVPEDCMGLAGLMPLRDIENRWIWASHDTYKDELKKLLSHVRDTYQYSLDPFRSIAGGACIPREFIIRYADTEIPELCNDEVRLPLFAQAFGIRLCDTGFYSLDDNERRYFNLFTPIDISRIREELGRSGGRRIFHPYYKTFSPAGNALNVYNLRYDAREAMKRLLKKVFGEKGYASLKKQFKKDFRPAKLP